MFVMFLINVCLKNGLRFSSEIPAVVRSIAIAGFFGFFMAFLGRRLSARSADTRRPYLYKEQTA
jgi:hypothetical protein